MSSPRPEVSEHTATHEAIFGVSELTATLLDDRVPFDVDWRTPASEMDEPVRLLRLARVKAILPADNALEEKTTHDVTLENYLRLALQAAGDRDTLSTFLDHVQVTLVDHPDDAKVLAQQVFWIWAPAAEVAGLYQHKTDLEDAAFQVIKPDDYAAITAEYDKAALAGENGLLARTSQKIHDALSEVFGDSVGFDIGSRSKSVYSVWRKMRSDGRSTNQIFDLLGIRAVIVLDGTEEEAIEQCYVAMSAAVSKFQSETSRLKDYIANPKPNGYQSLHLTLYAESGIPFELQVRTHDMHQAAESDGLLSHQTYDATYKETPGKIKQVFRKVPRQYQWRDAATQSIREHEGQMEGVMDGELLFFGADGNLYLTSADANALDASFRIHSRRALRTKGISLHTGKPIRLSDPVRHGDTLVVDYHPDYPTQRERFEVLSQGVNTSYARKAIESNRRKLLSEHYRQLGREAIIAQVADLGLDDPFSLLDEADRRRLADRVGMPNFNKLLEVIGVGDAHGKPTRIANMIRARCGLGDLVEIKTVPESRGTLDDQAVLSDLLIPNVGGKPNCQVAGCCSEKIRHGDDVLVRPSRLDGIFKVHLTECVNIRDHSGTIACSWVY